MALLCSWLNMKIMMVPCPPMQQMRAQTITYRLAGQASKWEGWSGVGQAEHSASLYHIIGAAQGTMHKQRSHHACSHNCIHVLRMVKSRQYPFVALADQHEEAQAHTYKCWTPTKLKSVPNVHIHELHIAWQATCSCANSHICWATIRWTSACQHR